MKSRYYFLGLGFLILLTIYFVYAVSVSTPIIYPKNAYENTSSIWCNATLTGEESTLTAQVEFGHNVSNFPYLFDDYLVKTKYGADPIHPMYDLVEYDGYLYITYYNTRLWKSNLNGESIEDILTGSVSPMHFTIWNDSIYFISNGNQDKILRYNLTGSWQENISLSYVPSGLGTASYYGSTPIDLDDDYIYILDESYDKLYLYYHNGTLYENWSSISGVFFRVSNSYVYTEEDGYIKIYNKTGSLLKTADMRYYIELRDNSVTDRKYVCSDLDNYAFHYREPYAIGANLTNKTNIFPFYISWESWQLDLVNSYAILVLGYTKQNKTVSNNTETELYRINESVGINNIYRDWILGEEYYCKVTPYNSTGAGTSQISEARIINDKNCPVDDEVAGIKTFKSGMNCKLHDANNNNYFFADHDTNTVLNLNGSTLEILENRLIQGPNVNLNITNGKIIGHNSYIQYSFSLDRDFYLINATLEGFGLHGFRASGKSINFINSNYTYNDYTTLYTGNLKIQNSKINVSRFRLFGSDAPYNITITDSNITTTDAYGFFTFYQDASGNNQIFINNSIFDLSDDLFHNFDGNKNITINIYNTNISTPGQISNGGANFTINCYNCTYSASMVSPDNEIFQSSSSKGWLKRYWYLDVTVLNYLGNPISNVNVTIKDKDNNTVYTGLTDSNGKIPRQSIKEYFVNGTTKINYNNYTITAVQSTKQNSTVINITENKNISLTIPNSPPKLEEFTFYTDKYFFDNFSLLVNATDSDGLEDRDTLKFLSYTLENFGLTNPLTLNIGKQYQYCGYLIINDTINESDQELINITLTNNSYSQNTSFSANLSEQRIYKNDTFCNYADNNLTYNLTHYNKYSGTLLTGGTFTGGLSNNSNVTLYSEWKGDWLNETYSLPILATDSVVKVNTYQTYNFTLNVSKTIELNFTNVAIDFSDYYNSTIYSNLSAYLITQNFTSTDTNLLLQLNASTIIQKAPSEISCPTDYIKGDYSGYGYCKLVTGTEDIREVYYIMWIKVKDNSSRNYEINFSMPFISEDLSDLISLNYTINNSNTDLSFSTSSKTLEIGKNHSTSSLSEGEYQVKVEFSYLYTEGTTGGGGGGPGFTAICGNGICEIGETPENCPIDCENATFELNLDHLVLIGHPGSKIKCWGIERGCALKVTNPSEKKIHIRVEIESNDKSKNWIFLSLDGENWAQILDFDIVGKSSRWVYFDINVPENVEVERDYQSNLKFTSSNYALNFPIVMRVEKKSPLSLDYLLLLLDSTVIKFPRSGVEIKLWQILFPLLLLLIILYPIFKGYGINKKVHDIIKYD